MAESKASLQYIERLLECVICLERYQRPKLLPCQHTFCARCLEGLVDHRKKGLRCPSCRAVHRLSPQGVEGYPNNLTITALLDIPTDKSDESKSSTEDEYTPKPCAECGTVAKLVCCFHCDRDLCPTCRDCHKQGMQEDINRDLKQLKQNISKLSSGYDEINVKVGVIKMEANSFNTHVWDTIEGYCRDLREQGTTITENIGKHFQSRMKTLQKKADSLKDQIKVLEVFYKSTHSRMKRQTFQQLKESELCETMQRCSKYLGRSPAITRTASMREKRSSSSTRSKASPAGVVQRPTMKRLQSLPDFENLSGASSSTTSPPRPMSPMATQDSETADSQSPPPQFTVGVIPEEVSIQGPDPMDTIDRDQASGNMMSMNILDNTFTETATDPNHPHMEQHTQIIVKAIIGKRGPRSWNPSAICISPVNATIIIVDSYKDLVQVLDRDGHFVTSFGSTGSSNGAFDYPSACACTREGNIVISDTFNHRIQVVDKLGVFLGKFGQFGKDAGCLEGPSGLAVDVSGYIYIADTNNYRIQVHSPDGGHVHTFGTPESLPSNMQKPRYSSIAIAANGDVYVSDGKNHCVHMFSYTGQYTSSIGKQGSGLGEFSSPRGLALDHNNHLWVADRDNHRVQVFLQSGEFLYGFGSQGEGGGQFQGPEGIALADNGDIVVAECGGQRIQIFSDKSLVH